MASVYNKSLIHEFEAKLNITFQDKLLLQRALTHKSFVNENSELNFRDNERLEFLGDSVLSIVISTYIFHNFPEYPEGELAKMRSVLVSATFLAKKAKNFNIGKFLLLGKGEEASGGRERNSILADAMEAIIAAIYLDQGLEKTREFLINIYKQDIKAVESGNYSNDYKTILQEKLQEKSVERPEYVVVDAKGPDHNKLFIINLKYKDEVLGRGKGPNKKEAEQKAAQSALKNMGYF